MCLVALDLTADYSLLAQKYPHWSYLIYCWLKKINCSPSGFFVLFYIEYLSPNVVDWKAVSKFTLAYAETMPDRAHHPTCPWIEIPEDRGSYAIHRQAAESGRQPLSGACWWTLIDLSSLPSFSAPPTSPVLWTFWENFCHATPDSSKLYLQIHRGSSSSFVVFCIWDLCCQL